MILTQRRKVAEYAEFFSGRNFSASPRLCVKNHQTFSYIFSYLGIGSRIPPDFA